MASQTNVYDRFMIKFCLYGVSSHGYQFYKYSTMLCFRNSRSEPLTTVKQCKGKGEMSVADWQVELQGELENEHLAICLVTSGNIDAIYIHLYVVSRY